MMSNKDFVDTHIDELRKRVPKMMAEHPGALEFLRAFSDLSNAIIQTAAVLDDETRDYAKQRVTDVILQLGLAPKLRAV